MSFDPYESTCYENLHNFYMEKTSLTASLGESCPFGMYQPGEYSPFDSVYTAEGPYSGQESSSSFLTKPIVDWQGEDCVNWAKSVCLDRGLDASAINLWVLRNATGPSLLQSSRGDFYSSVSSQYGDVLFQELQFLSNKSNASANHWSSCCEVSQGPAYPATPPFKGYDEPFPNEFNDEDLDDLVRHIPQEVWDLLPPNLDEFPMGEQPVLVKSEEITENYLPVSTPSTDLGLPLPCHLAETQNDVFKKIPTNTRRKERGPKSWEFLIRLLADKRTNPSLIRWEDEPTATFRLTQPKIIAQMWGARAGKTHLSYVNFARGLRYHYNTGALIAVSERQLVYRCGPKALQYLREVKGDST
ncbi:transcriptional regulator ERG-like [Palaemon carinicauda]|uniref:transcriptional regulator ERG-like n=1 Tax=Palaemon carinicauda TaxID=392227 RepID=UPI0035B5EC8F